MAEIQWIIFSYKIPTEPSSVRVRVWRNLKTLGVHYIQQSVCIIPSREEVKKKLRKLELLIAENGGETTVLKIDKLSEQSETLILAEFNKERLIEYNEFIQEANKFREEIANESKKANFSFSEIEENEVELRRLKKWLTLIKSRDYFSCELQEKTAALFEECNFAFEEFTNNVYKHEGIIGE
ncbi:Chromate resistance protein ChrB [Metabacillus fastidiosus]|uniref:Chromate resistance protein ChrB n=1 Tax=Metabacillus fastidiosus TaxID=1458 RepID=UPI003D28DE5F